LAAFCPGDLVLIKLPQDPQGFSEAPLYPTPLLYTLTGIKVTGLDSWIHISQAKHWTPEPGTPTREPLPAPAAYFCEPVFKRNTSNVFISQQVQQIKFQFLVKEYSPLPMYEPSDHFHRGLHGRIHGSAPETSTTIPTPLSPHGQQEAARRIIAPLPNSNWVLVIEGDLVAFGNLRDR
jgi:hypothetical protein